MKKKRARNRVSNRKKKEKTIRDDETDEKTRRVRDVRKEKERRIRDDRKEKKRR